MKNYRVFPMLAALLFLLSGCVSGGISMEVINGSGAIVTEERDVSGFKRVEINMGAELILEQGETEGLTIEARENLLPYLTSEVSGNKLILSTQKGYSLVTATPIIYRLTVKDLDEVVINGAVMLSGSDLSLDKLEVTFNGAGNCTLSGSIDDQRIIISGGANYDAGQVESRDVRVEINGLGTVFVNASDTLDVTINGTGTVTYSGNPAVTEDINGLGSVNKK